MLNIDELFCAVCAETRSYLGVHIVKSAADFVLQVGLLLSIMGGFRVQRLLRTLAVQHRVGRWRGVAWLDAKSCQKMRRSNLLPQS